MTGSGIARLASYLLLAGALHVPGALADRPPEPLWEIGAGIGTLAFPPWPGSRQHDLFVTPMPYVVYRGERIQADRGGIRGLLFGTDTIDLRLSLAASPPPRDDDASRDGMPGLDPVLEFGPEIRWKAWSSADQHLAFYLRLPLRKATAVSSSGLEGAGWFASPALNLEIRDWPGAGWKIGLNTGPVFGDADYHAYYYDVAPRYATPERPAWKADAGYGGMQFTGSVSRRRGKLWFGAFLRAQYLGGADFEDSPLVGTDSSISGGVAFAWIFAQSKTMVRRADRD